MNTRTWKQAGLVMALVGSATFAQAQQRGQRLSREDMIAKYDTDKDGKLSDTEKAAMKTEMGERRGGNKGQGGERPDRAEMIAKYDTDKDGTLSETEKAAMKAEMGERRGGNKGQGGQRMSAEEALAKYDADKDGKLSETERATMKSEMQAKRSSKGGPKSEKENKGSERLSREEMIAKYDTDKDGKLSETERAALRKDMDSKKKSE